MNPLYYAKDTECYCYLLLLCHCCLGFGVFCFVLFLPFFKKKSVNVLEADCLCLDLILISGTQIRKPTPIQIHVCEYTFMVSALTTHSPETLLYHMSLSK